LKISTSYFWPKMRQNIKRHKKYCLWCQQQTKSTNKQTPLAPLPIPERPNLRIHANHFGPMITADSNKKFVLCITDAFTKYAFTFIEQLTNPEQPLWTKFETRDIYRYLTGEEDTVPEFPYNWTSIPRLQPLGHMETQIPAPAQAPTPPEALPAAPPAPVAPPVTSSSALQQVHHIRHQLPPHWVRRLNNT
jgi:hypothetical protein